MELHSGSLTDHAYRKLEGLIVTLKLAPGSMVTEKQLVEIVGQGRTPVREAIQRLEWQGLIRIRPRVGMQITEIVESMHCEIMLARRQLEPLVAAIAAEHVTEGQREALVDCARAMGAAAATADMIGFLAADKLFDDIIDAACPNRFLTAALAPLQTQSRRRWFANATPDMIGLSAQMHIAIIRAVQAKDAKAASAAMQHLLDHVSKI